MTEQVSAPVLSTDDKHIFEDATNETKPLRAKRLNDAQIVDIYEVQRTAREIRAGGWKTVALQFPDGMLCDAPRVSDSLETALRCLPVEQEDIKDDVPREIAEVDVAKRSSASTSAGSLRQERLAILADTSYGACCVDEIAAEHAEAEVVVHYGRSCLSPTARLPVIYVYTSHDLPLDPLVFSFTSTFPDRESRVVLMADITYSNHLEELHRRLKLEEGYTKVFVPEIVHDPSSLLPNRTVPLAVSSGLEELNSYHLFHISDPPPALLLTLSSRLSSMYIYSTDSSSSTPTAMKAQTSRSLSRRYGLLTSLTTVPIIGILINTLSVRNYLPTISLLQSQITSAGKKYYTMVVGKVNPAKIANFAEIEGWVVVGCWESSLIDSKDFFKPIVTPFELGLALMGDDERVWTGEWRGDFAGILQKEQVDATSRASVADTAKGENEDNDEDAFSDEESAPPEYDLRTGRYVSHSRPMRLATHHKAPHPTTVSPQISSKPGQSQALQKRATGDLAMINGTASPGADFLRQNRTWQGLGSDFEIKYEEERGVPVEEGRSGVARGYTVGEGVEKH